MPLGIQVGLDPSDIVLDGDPARSLPQKGIELPIFGPCLLWPNGRPSQLLLSTCKTRMWADAYRDGRPAEYRWSKRGAKVPQFPSLSITNAIRYDK